MGDAFEDVLKQLVLLLANDRPLHDAVVRLLNASAEGKEISNARARSRVPQPQRALAEKVFKET